VRGLGLDLYYQRRQLDPGARSLRPDPDAPVADLSQRIEHDGHGLARLQLMVDGLQCAACVWLIEAVLNRQPGVSRARLNLTTRRLTLEWREGEADPGALVALVNRLGYHLVPFDPALLEQAEDRAERELLRALAVAGFAAGNVMLLSVGVWAGYQEGMGEATRTLMHWLSALICLPAIVYAGRPFVRSAVRALAAGRTNMDVPISIGVTLTAAMSLSETIRGGTYAYFDSAVTLLFFLLIGRFLDLRARARARLAAGQLVGLQARAVTVLEADGRARVVAPEQVEVGQTVLVAVGERVPVDGVVRQGQSELDASLVTGESLPQAVAPGSPVFAGTLNLGAPLRLTVGAVGASTLLAEIVRLMELAQQGRGRLVLLADRIARRYAPVVHCLALLTFLGWWQGLGLAWQPALMIAVSVLIITCPCALALAVPVVQVVASGRLLRRGILLKSASALERLAEVDTIVCDKTGTLTLGQPTADLSRLAESEQRLAAALAGASRHPLARALVRAVPGVPVAEGVREHPGAGLSLATPAGEIRLGSRTFVLLLTDKDGDNQGPELWLSQPGQPPRRIGFDDPLRRDAAETLAHLRARGYRLVLLSGDRRASVAAVAGALGLADWHAEQAPADKLRHLEQLKQQGRRVLMVGDGLNDAPALAAAWASLSPASAVDLSQTAADVVFQGERLAPLAETLATACRTRRLVAQNLTFSLGYNALAVPLAVLGLVTPLIAAIAMSTSSLVVIANSLRLGTTLRVPPTPPASSRKPGR